jgi:hypothetical protein
MEESLVFGREFVCLRWVQLHCSSLHNIIVF